MRQRISNPSDPDYPAYGGAGLTFDPAWDDFGVFLSHIGFKPKDGKRYSVDRIDNDKGYVHGNVRWATDAQQARNKGSYKNNSTGVTGVKWNVNPNTGFLSAVACYKDLASGRNRVKAFAVTKYGLLPAFAMAVFHRRAMIDKLNDAGAGYSAKHGQ